jgi:hypothetical protein
VNTPAQAAATPPTAALSEPQRILNIFFDPRRTFADLQRSAAFWGPLLVMLVFSIAFTYSIDRQIGFEQVAENMTRNSPRAAQFEQLPAEQQERQIRGMAMGMKYFSYGGVVMFGIMMLVIAAVLMGTFNFGLGAEVPFKQAFAIVVYASLPLSVVRSTLAIASILAGADPQGFNLQNPVATNPGYFLNPQDGAFLFALLSHVDIVMIWTLVLTAIGFSTLSKVKTGTAAVAVFAWYAVFALVMSGFALMGG